jgi:hypothetical protein
MQSTKKELAHGGIWSLRSHIPFHSPWGPLQEFLPLQGIVRFAHSLPACGGAMQSTKKELAHGGIWSLRSHIPFHSPWGPLQEFLPLQGIVRFAHSLPACGGAMQSTKRKMAFK